MYDFAPYCRFAGLLYGITNTVASIPGIVAPNVVAALTTHVSINYSTFKQLK